MDPEPIPVTLLKSQEQNVLNHISILSTSKFSIDNSVMGAGKSHMTAYIEQYFQFPHMIVVSPAGVENVWVKVGKMYGLPIDKIISYESLAIRKKEKINTTTKLVVRNENGDYTPSDYLISIIAEGTLFVFDEFHKIKNSTTDNHKASKAIINYICDNETSSRIMFLSATPFDDGKQIIDFLRMVRIIKSRNLYQVNSGNPILIGASELQAFCYAIDKQETINVTRMGGVNKLTPSQMCIELYKHVIAKYFSTAAEPPPMTNEIDLDCKNGYYLMTTDRSKKLRDAIQYLHHATRYNPVDGVMNLVQANWGAITGALLSIEILKIEIFYRKALDVLNTDPQAKVCIFLNFKKPLHILSLLLSEYNPLVLDGSIPKGKRAAIVSKFQEHNTSYRILISNVVVGSFGLDLDDTHGQFQRYFFISPGYKAMVLHQATHRAYRANTKSTPIVRFIFGLCGREETSILDALVRRKITMKSVIPKQLEHGSQIKFPGEYEQEIERGVIEGNVIYNDTVTITQEEIEEIIDI